MELVIQGMRLYRGRDKAELLMYAAYIRQFIYWGWRQP